MHYVRVLMTLVTTLGGAHTAATPSSLTFAIDGQQLAPNGHVSSLDPDGPLGWRMRDRFRAFRFAFTLPQDTHTSADALLESVASHARDHKCFGWIQQTDPTHAAGEARCPTRFSSQIETHLDGVSGQLHIHHYATSKIRYHFPTFRVLSESKYTGKTCFQSPPHACRSVSEPQ